MTHPDLAPVLAHFGARGIMGDDLMMGVGLRGCRVAWPAGYWPRLEDLLDRDHLLQPMAGWATCRVRCGPALAVPGREPPDLEWRRHDLAVVCVPLSDAAAPGVRRRWGGPEVWDHNVPAFVVPASPGGAAWPFQFMFDRTD